MKIIKAILNQTVDLIFGLIALGLLISYIIHTNNMEILLSKIHENLWAGNDLAAKTGILLAERLTRWHEGYGFILVIGYVAFNIINKVQMNLNREDICKACGKSMVKREESVYFCTNSKCDNYLKTQKP